MLGNTLSRGMNNLGDAVKGKDVLLVGNSSSILGARLGTKIDSFEFVIRFNLSIAHLNSSTGKKTNAWIFAMARQSVCEKIHRLAHPKPNLCVRHPRHPTPPLSFDHITLDASISDVQRALETDLDPSVGVCTLWYLLNHCEAKSISLVGFDSFLKSNFYTARKHRSNHPGDKERLYIERLRTNGEIIFLN